MRRILLMVVAAAAFAIALPQIASAVPSGNGNAIKAAAAMISDVESTQYYRYRRHRYYGYYPAYRNYGYYPRYRYYRNRGY